VAHIVRFSVKVKRTESQPPETRRQFYERFGRDVPHDPDWPREAAHLWRTFWDIARDRLDATNGPQPLGPALILDWIDATATPLSPDEVGVIRAMDAAWMGAYAAERSAEWRPSTKGK